MIHHPVLRWLVLHNENYGVADKKKECFQSSICNFHAANINPCTATMISVFHICTINVDTIYSSIQILFYPNLLFTVTIQLKYKYCVIMITMQVFPTLFTLHNTRHFSAIATFVSHLDSRVFLQHDVSFLLE